jgi:hypothetical protein
MYMVVYGLIQELPTSSSTPAKTVSPPYPAPMLPWSYLRDRLKEVLEPVRELWRPRLPDFSF